jgi:hypothetical protein
MVTVWFLLSKGFKFVHSRRKVDIGKLIADIKTWERRMRLREYFFDDKDQDQELIVTLTRPYIVDD